MNGCVDIIATIINFLQLFDNPDDQQLEGYEREVPVETIRCSTNPIDICVHLWCVLL